MLRFKESYKVILVEGFVPSTLVRRGLLSSVDDDVHLLGRKALLFTNPETGEQSVDARDLLSDGDYFTIVDIRKVSGKDFMDVVYLDDLMENWLSVGRLYVDKRATSTTGAKKLVRKTSFSSVNIDNLLDRVEAEDFPFSEFSPDWTIDKIFSFVFRYDSAYSIMDYLPTYPEGSDCLVNISDKYYEIFKEVVNRRAYSKICSVADASPALSSNIFYLTREGISTGSGPANSKLENIFSQLTFKPIDSYLDHALEKEGHFRYDNTIRLLEFEKFNNISVEGHRANVSIGRCLSFYNNFDYIRGRDNTFNKNGSKLAVLDTIEDRSITDDETYRLVFIEYADKDKKPEYMVARNISSKDNIWVQTRVRVLDYRILREEALLGKLAKPLSYLEDFLIHLFNKFSERGLFFISGVSAEFILDIVDYTNFIEILYNEIPDQIVAAFDYSGYSGLSFVDIYDMVTGLKYDDVKDKKLNSFNILGLNRDQLSLTKKAIDDYVEFIKDVFAKANLSDDELTMTINSIYAFMYEDLLTIITNVFKNTLGDDFKSMFDIDIDSFSFVLDSCINYKKQLVREIALYDLGEDSFYKRALDKYKSSYYEEPSLTGSAIKQLLIFRYLTIHDIKFLNNNIDEHFMELAKFNLNKNMDLVGRFRYGGFDGLFRDYARMIMRIKEAVNYDKENGSGIEIDRYTKINRSVLLDFEMLLRAHDEVIPVSNLVKSNHDDAKFKEISDKYSSYNYRSNCGLSMVVPERTLDIVEEGSKLNHCVSGYIDSIVDEETLVLFVRRNEDLDKPYYTVEVKNNRVVQVRGFSNEKPTQDVLDFVEEWKLEKLKK